MRLGYNREEDILMIEMSPEGVIDHAEHTGPLITHFGKDGQLLLLEVLNASEFLASLIKVTVRGQHQELPLPIG
jgi:hypothetical protein